MSSPIVYLEGSAKKYALAAVKAEKDGDYEHAYLNLKRAVELLEDIVKNYPDHPLASLYKRLIGQYRRKLRELEEKLRKLPATGDDEEYFVETSDDTGDINRMLPPNVMRVEPSITFNDIADLEQAKRAIMESIVYPVRRPDLFPLGWHRGILLFGPSGTGKTTLATATASEVGGEFLYVDAASIMSKWLGEGEKNVRRLFAYARERAKSGVPVVIFIDEVDALLGVYSSEVGGEVRVRNQFLKEMDGVLDKTLNLHLFVIGATNKPWRLDEAFLRRFQKRIYIPLPDKSARRKLLELLTRNIKLDESVDLDKLAEMLEGYSGSDIRDVIRDAYTIVVREVFEKGGTGEPRPLTMDDFREVIARRRPSVDSSLVSRFEEWASKFSAI